MGTATEMQALQAGGKVRVFGLVKAAQHNGKIGKVIGKTPEGRVGVDLGGGVTLALKKENLEPVTPKPATGAAGEAHMLGKERTLERNNSLLLEFHGSPDPNVLVLYHHLRDHAFDCFNAAEYLSQMQRYYDNGMTVVTVVPRKLQDAECFLVCLVNKDPDRNTLCEVAFQAMRQFVGISMLVKQRCFVCGKPGAPKCACGIACYCPGDCTQDGKEHHSKLCKLVKNSGVVVCEEESMQLL